MGETTTNAHRKNPRRRPLAVGVARILLLPIMLGVIVRMMGCAESLAYFPSREPFTTPSGTEDIYFESADGVRLHAWFMPARSAPTDEPRPAILHVHGNAGNVASHDSFSRFLTDHGFHVLLFDYRRYGRSDDRGPLRRDALLRDTSAALQALKQRADVDPSRIGVYGVSLGGAFALNAAAGDPDVRAVATLSAFSTWKGIAGDHAPVLGSLLMPAGLEPASAAASLGDRPLLVMHGLRDEIIPSRHAEILVRAAKESGVAVELWTDPEGDHNSLVQVNPEAQEKLAEFFAAHLGSAPGSSHED